MQHLKPNHWQLDPLTARAGPKADTGFSLALNRSHNGKTLLGIDDSSWPFVAGGPLAAAIQTRTLECETVRRRPLPLLADAAIPELRTGDVMGHEQSFLDLHIIQTRNICNRQILPIGVHARESRTSSGASFSILSVEAAMLTLSADFSISSRMRVNSRSLVERRTL